MPERPHRPSPAVAATVFRPWPVQRPICASCAGEWNVSAWPSYLFVAILQFRGLCLRPGVAARIQLHRLSLSLANPVTHRFAALAAVLLLVACDRSEAPPVATGDHATTATPHGAQGEPAQVAASATPDSNLVAVVYKDANCGCCSKWVDHIRDAGFKAVAHDVTDLDAIKRRNGIPGALHSCHTAEIGGYLVEGHVPADLIQKMLRERPDIAGLAVPGMPVGSPGMEWTYSEPYEVIAFTRSGATSVYANR